MADQEDAKPDEAEDPGVKGPDPDYDPAKKFSVPGGGIEWTKPPGGDEG